MKIEIKKNKRVFVTGGAGVIGMELIPKLISLDADILVGDLKPMPKEFFGRVRYRRGDLKTLTMSELIAFDPEIIIHLAATFERSEETLGFWAENFQHNVLLSHHLMTLAQNCKNLQRVVFASSYLIYDESLYQFDAPQRVSKRLKEEDNIRPRNLTGMAKLAHEQELLFLNKFSDFSFTTLCVRIFRGYGRGSRDVISRWVRNLLRGDQILVYRPEGRFDYIYSADSAEGLLRLAFLPEATGVVNLGTGRSCAVGDVLQELRKYFPQASISYEGTDIPYEASEACTEKLEKLLGWTPSKSLELTIPEIIEFEKAKFGAVVESNLPRIHIKSVLLTSASRKAPLLMALKQAALRIDQDTAVIAGDMDSLAICRYEAESFWEMPHLASVDVDKLIDECKSRSISVIFPSRDGELEFWARYRDTFANAGIEVIISPLESIKRCRDKLLFAQYGAKECLPVIPAMLSAEELSCDRFVVKERFGSGSRGLCIDVTYEQALKFSRQLEQPIFQPYLAGDEISVDAWIGKTGKIAGLVLRRRDRVSFGESCVTTTFRDASLESQAFRVIDTLELRGPVVLQAIVSEGVLNVIECNPRFGGASTASLAVGLDSLYWSLNQVVDDGFQPIFRRLEQDIRQVRYPVDRIFYDSNF
jgi:carbamoyl-phosphate synthase large subunit